MLPVSRLTYFIHLLVSHLVVLLGFCRIGTNGQERLKDLRITQPGLFIFDRLVVFFSRYWCLSVCSEHYYFRSPEESQVRVNEELNA